ncbi:hypothetical protein C1886_25950, partial [Pseudomonas sp. FW300-N1A1]
MAPDFLWGRACSRRRPGSQPFSCGCGVHILCCGHGYLWFRPYGGSLWQTPQSNQRSRPERPAPRRGSGFPRLRHSSGGIAS